MNALLETASAMARGTPAQNPAPAPRARILLVDDDPDDRELNAGILIRSGYTVDTAGDGAEAWQALHAENYDLLITNNKLPRVTGLDLIGKLRSEAVTLPIILAAATMRPEELEQHAWMQLHAALPKPFNLATLLETVEKVLCSPGSVREQLDSSTAPAMA